MSGIDYLIDTNVIIGFVQRDLTVQRLLSDKPIERCAYSAVTRIELLSFSTLTFAESQAIKMVLDRMHYLRINRDIENETIEFRRLHKTKLPDSIIAATAKHFQLELLTLDKKLASKLSQNNSLLRE